MLKRLFASIVRTATTIGTRKLDQLGEKNPILVRLAGIFILAGKDVITALLDNDKDNAAQIKKILKTHAQSVIMEGAEMAREKVLSFKDVALANAVVIYLNGTEELLKALVDDNPDNEQQAKDILDKYKGRILPPTVDLATDKIAEVLGPKIKDPVIAALVLEILEAIDTLVQTDEPDPIQPPAF